MPNKYASDQVVSRSEPWIDSPLQQHLWYSSAMAKGSCIKIELDVSNYSSPVPAIGLYIAAASLVCSLTMLYDIWSGYRCKKQWLPCRWFSLNSVTLTLLSIAAKIPVDLTTPMAGTLDQFSKLSGTSLICISMAFLMPSLGIDQSSECLKNMAALSIFVVTVIVNISIQMSTGVIFMFTADHIIILCCMLALLVSLWVSALDINKQKGSSIDHNKDLLTKGTGSMMQRMKLSYLYGYNYNPQFLLCRQPNCHFAGLLCILCSVVTVRAMLSSLTSEFCGRISDYDWSMWIIVVTQILTIVIGSSATTFRSWFTLVKNLKYNPIGRALKDETRTLINSNVLMVNDYYGEVLHLLMMLQIGFVIVFAIIPLCLVVIAVQKLIGRALSFISPLEDDRDIQEYINLVHDGDMGFDRWSLGRSVKDMKRWLEVSNSQSLNHLSELILKTRPSLPLDTMVLRDQNHCIEVSSLSMVLLVRITQLSIPSQHSDSLVQAYAEARELIQYIDDNIISASGENRTKSKLAKAVRGGHELSTQRIFDVTESSGASQILSDLDRALVIIRRLKDTLPLDSVWKQVATISSYIDSREYSAIEDLYNYLEQLFVYMLHMYLAEIPNAVFKEVAESSAETFDKRIRTALKLLCQIESMEEHIEWSFPVQCDISSLITAADATTQSPAADPTTQSPAADPTTQSPNDTVIEVTQSPAADPTTQSPTADPTTQSPTDTVIEVTPGPATDPTTLSPTDTVIEVIPGLVADPTTQSPAADPITQSPADAVIEVTPGLVADPTTQSPAADPITQSPTLMSSILEIPIRHHSNHPASSQSQADLSLFKKLWNLKIPANNQIFLWKVLNKALPVGNILDRHRVVGDLNCCWCHTEMESHEHLFLSCEWVRRVWFFSPVNLVTQSRTDWNWSQWCEQFLIWCAQDTKSMQFNLSFCLFLMNELWTLRNHVKCGDKAFHFEFSLVFVIESAKSAWEKWWKDLLCSSPACSPVSGIRTRRATLVLDSELAYVSTDAAFHVCNG